MPRCLRWTYGRFAFFLASCFASGCGDAAIPAGSTQQTNATPVQPQATNLTFIKPLRKTVRRVIEEPAFDIRPFQQTPLYSKLAGYVGKVHKDIGDRVKKDELLAELDVPEMAIELKQKDALVRHAEASVKQAEEAASAAAANMKSASALLKEAESGRLKAQAEYKRFESQFKRMEQAARGDVINRDALDESRYRLEAAEASRGEIEAKVQSAQATFEESKAKRDKALADVDVAKAQRDVAVANRDNVKTMLGYIFIRAPFAGVVTKRNVDTGHFVQPNAGGTRGEPLFVVQQMDPVRVFVNVREGDANLIYEGADARVRVQGEEYRGKVTRTSWALDPKSRTLSTEIDLPNPDGKLRAGMYAYAAITIEHKEVWTVPAPAISTQGEQNYCFLAENGKSIRTAIQVGIRDNQVVEVLRIQRRLSKDASSDIWSDWSGTEEIIAGNQAALVDGQPIPTNQP